jgi:hypothetical protein
MDANEIVKSRREQLGLSDVEVALCAGLTIGSYYHVEHYPDEIWDFDLCAVKKLCAKLQLSLFELAIVHCAFCGSARHFEETFSLPRNELINHERNKNNWSVDELGDRVGFYGVEIEHLESDAVHIENWCVSNLKQLSEALDIPLQILLGVRCPACNR